jgi:hypothetical protein
MLPIPSAFWSREAARAEVEDFVVALNRDLISAEDFRLDDREGRRH